MICLLLGLWQYFFIKTKNIFSRFEATNLLEVIKISMNWQDIQTARCSRFGNLVEKNVSFFCLLQDNIKKVNRFCMQFKTC